MTDAFYTLYSGLAREGPGEPADIRWVADLVGLPRNARICDAGCGSGANIEALLSVAPEGHVTAVDRHKPFIDELYAHIGADPRVMAYAGNMAKLKGPFDLIWSAGAVYFLGIKKALKAWRPALSKTGVVAFSEPCWFSDTRSRAGLAFWEGEGNVTDAAGIAEQAEAAGYDVIGTRRLSDAAWEAYYTPLEARIAALRPSADAALTEVLDQSTAEIANWRAAKADTGYLLSVVRPR